MITLFIDTSDNKVISVGLKSDGKEYIKKQKTDHRKAQAVLPLIENILKERKLSLQDINAIEVNSGPGSFTGLRVGITIANTLGFLLKIPVNDRNMVEPVY